MWVIQYLFQSNKLLDSDGSVHLCYSSLGEVLAESREVWSPSLLAGELCRPSSFCIHAILVGQTKLVRNEHYLCCLTWTSIGNLFSLLEQKLFLSMALQRFTFEKGEGCNLKPIPTWRTCRPVAPKITLIPRKNEYKVSSILVISFLTLFQRVQKA